MSTFPNRKHNTPVIKLNQPDDNYKFRPLPKPSGEYPYHLAAVNLLSTNSDELVFHMVGDTGGRLNPDFQKKVAAEMTRQFDGVVEEEGNPRFLTLVADIEDPLRSHGTAAGTTLSPNDCPSHSV